MNVFIKRKYFGMTLIELLISIALFAMMAAVAAYTISSGIRAHSFDRRVRNAQTAARDVITKLCNEMRCASSAPTITPMTEFGIIGIPSGVLYPDSYGDAYAKDQTEFKNYPEFYHVGTKKVAGNTDTNLVYYSKNRVIFIRPKTAITSLDSNTVAGESFNPSDPNDYVYVEWYVPYASQNRVFRRVFVFSEGSSGGHEYVKSGDIPYWLIVPKYFENAKNLVKGSTATASGADRFLVGSLDGEYDSFDLCVYHARYIYPGTSNPGTEMPYQTCYERNLFTVELNTRVMKGKEKVTRDSSTKRWTSAHKDYSEASLTQQVRIQSGS